MANTLTTDLVRSVSISLHRDLRSGEWFVDHIEMRFGPVRNVTSFARDILIRDAFTSSFLAQLYSFLPDGPETQLNVVSGAAIELADSVMHGMRVFAQPAANDIQLVIVRFKDVQGQIYDFLVRDHRPDACLGTLPDFLDPAQPLKPQRQNQHPRAARRPLKSLEKELVE